MAGFDRFNKRWADNGQIEAITENNANLGLAFLGNATPSAELHNQMFQWLDEKDNYLFQQIQNAVVARTGSPLGPGTMNALRDAIAFEATTAKAGIQRNATGPETQAMTVANRTVTPASLKPLIDSLMSGIANSVPPGGVVAFASSAAPAGWIVAAGQAISRADNIALFNAIGTTFGAGNGTTTFNVPNIQGAVIRGWNGSGTGVDSGRGFGSIQQPQNQAHTHTGTVSASGDHDHDGVTGTSGLHNHPASASSSGSHTHGYTDYRTAPSSSGAGAGTGSGFTTQALSSTTGSGGSHSHGITVGDEGGHMHSVQLQPGGVHTHTVTLASEGGEARMYNIALLYCIKL